MAMLSECVYRGRGVMGRSGVDQAVPTKMFRSRLCSYKTVFREACRVVTEGKLAEVLLEVLPLSSSHVLSWHVAFHACGN